MAGSFYPHTWQGAREYLGAKNDRPLEGRATRLQRREGDRFAVKYQSTDVVIYHPDGSIELNSGGWQTLTTKARITEYAPIALWSDRGIWYVSEKGGGWQDRQTSRRLYVDGLIILPGGGLHGPGGLELEDPARAEGFKRRLDRMIAKYIAGYAREVCKPEPFGEPGPGDCLLCQIALSHAMGQPGPVGMTGRLHPGGRLEDTTGQRDPFGLDHLLEHCAEGYYVPGLYALACVEAGYGGGPAIGWQMGVSRKDAGWIRRELNRYFRKRKPGLLRLLEGGWRSAAELEREAS